jgi:Zn-dependent membrane protease YugP
MMIGPVSTEGADSTQSNLTDFYGMMMKGIGIMSQDMYRHARETEELGPFVLRANFLPILAIIVAVLIVAGAILLLIGQLTKSETLRDIGLALVTLGLLLLVIPLRDSNAPQRTERDYELDPIPVQP